MQQQDYDWTCLIVAIIAVSLVVICNIIDNKINPQIIHGFGRTLYGEAQMAGNYVNATSPAHCDPDNMVIPDSLKHRFPKWEQNEKYR